MTQPPSPGESPAPGGFPPPYPGQAPQPQYGAPPPGWGPPPGAYPPPPGAYPPPGAFPPGAYPPGGYPPPPSAEGGYFPPPPGYGRPAFSVTEGVSWSWNKFAKNAIPVLVGTLALILIPLAVLLLTEWVVGKVSPDTVTVFETGGDIVAMSSQTLTGPGLAVMALGWLAMTFVGAALAAAYFGGLLDIADGRPVTVSSFFRPRSVGSVVIATLLISLLMLIVNVITVILLGLITSVSPALGLISSVVLSIPVLILGLFSLFTTVAIVDRTLSPIDGIKESFRITREHFGQVILAWLAGSAILFLGLLTCGLGLIVAIPVVYLLLVYTYRKLSGGTVVPAS